jgi:hypothetical protein
MAHAAPPASLARTRPTATGKRRLGVFMGERGRLIALSSTLAVVCAWSALRLPWRSDGWLGLCLGGLSLLHALTAVAAAFGASWLPTARRVLSLASLACATVFSAVIAITAVVLVARYGPLGWGLSALLALIGVLALAATLPVGLWGPWRARETHGEP